MYAYHFMMHRATRHAYTSAKYCIHQNNVSSSVWSDGKRKPNLHKFRKGGNFEIVLHACARYTQYTGERVSA
jgi:hypothetical protein